MCQTTNLRVMREKLDLKNSMKNVAGIPMKKRIKIIFTLVFAFALALNLSGCGQKSDTESVPDELPQQETEIPQEELPAEESKNTIEIPQEDDTDKMVAVPVEDLGRANPFLPPGEAALITSAPQEKLQYDLLEPLDAPVADEMAQKIVTTKVSGIMYDKSNPSAILNIEGADYLVRSGDVINGYKVLSIGKNHVTVQKGSNVYKAGVGQLVTEGQTDVTYNQVANLNKKFGGGNK